VADGSSGDADAIRATFEADGKPAAAVKLRRRLRASRQCGARENVRAAFSWPVNAQHGATNNL
jgi:hypothetical protein